MHGLFANEGGDLAKNSMAPSAYGNNVEILVQKAFLKVYGFDWTEFVTAVAADTSFVIEGGTVLMKWINGSRGDRTAIVATAAFDAFGDIDVRFGNQLPPKPFEHGKRKRQDTHEVGRCFYLLEIPDDEILDAGTDNIDVCQARGTEIGTACRQQDRQGIWRQIDEGGSDCVDGRQILAGDDKTDFAWSAAAGTIAFHGDDRVDDGEGRMGRAVDVDNEVSEFFSVLETEMVLCLGDAWNQPVLIFQGAGHGHEYMRLEFGQGDEDIAVFDLFGQFQMGCNSVSKRLEQGCFGKVGDCGMFFVGNCLDTA